MALQTFAVETVYMQPSVDDCCIQVTAKPLIKIYRIPRGFADSLINEPDLKQAGIYLLINRAAKTLYVGQADARDNGNGVLRRMLEPHTKKAEIDKWDVGYALISGTPQFFGATELNYLERFFYEKALSVGRYALLNGNKPHSSNIGLATKIMLDNYTEHAFFLLRKAAECDVFVVEPKFIGPSSNTSIPNASILIVDSVKRDAHAEGIYQDGNKMLVYKGSRISTDSNLMNQKGQASVEKIRQALIDSGVVKDRVFTSDYVFNSPSAAAAVILGTASSGNEKWKDKNGVPLGELLKTKQL